MADPALNPAAAVFPAVERMRQLLFRPFRAQRWLVLGFFSFLEGIGGGGGGTGAHFGGNGRDVHPWRHHGTLVTDPQLHEFTGWVHEHLALLLVAGAVALVLGLALAVLLHWLGARATFGHLDGVATGRYEVVQA
jgi:hypothetical protein